MQPTKLGNCKDTHTPTHKLDKMDLLSHTHVDLPTPREGAPPTRCLKTIDKSFSNVIELYFALPEHGIVPQHRSTLTHTPWVKLVWTKSGVSAATLDYTHLICIQGWHHAVFPNWVFHSFSNKI
jgi:hypothetical protein